MNATLKSGYRDFWNVLVPDQWRVLAQFDAVQDTIMALKERMAQAYGCAEEVERLWSLGSV